MSVDILCIGEGMAELVSDGDLRFETTFTKNYAGDVLNTAIGAARLGSRVAFLSGVGDDPLGFGLRNLLVDEGVDVSCFKIKKNAQIGLYFKSREVDGKTSFHYYRKNSAASLLNEFDIREETIKKAKIVYASGISMAISESAKRAVLKAFELARANGVMTAFDPNYRKKLWETESDAIDAYRQAIALSDIVLPTVPDDTRFLLGISTRPDRVIDALWRRYVKLVVVKMGADGCYLGYKKEMERVDALPIPPRQIIDLTGSGDAFNAGFLHGMARQMSLSNCARLGVTTAGLKIQRPGTIAGLPYRDEVYSQCFPEPVEIR